MLTLPENRNVITFNRLKKIEIWWYDNIIFLQERWTEWIESKNSEAPNSSTSIQSTWRAVSSSMWNLGCKVMKSWKRSSDFFTYFLPIFYPRVIQRCKFETDQGEADVWHWYIGSIGSVRIARGNLARRIHRKEMKQLKHDSKMKKVKKKHILR